MKVVKINKIPIQKCRNCASLVELQYKDLKWEDDRFKLRRNMWTCPMCKERINFIYNFEKQLTNQHENKGE
jgi:hypothetical protein